MKSPRIKFILGGLLILAAVVYLIFSSTQASAQYFLTVDELIAKGDTLIGRDLRVSGAIIGDNIQYDPQTLELKFTVAHVTGDNAQIETDGIENHAVLLYLELEMIVTHNLRCAHDL